HRHRPAQRGGGLCICSLPFEHARPTAIMTWMSTLRNREQPALDTRRHLRRRPSKATYRKRRTGPSNATQHRDQSAPPQRRRQHRRSLPDHRFDRQPQPRPPQSTIPQLTSLLINNAGALGPL
ncbi:putative transposase for IS2404, partial [Mycobacterium ulcerans str. Harvey]